MKVEVVLMPKCREDARIDHPGEALQVMRRRLRRAKTVACAYPVVIDLSFKKKKKKTPLYMKSLPTY